LKKRVLSTSLRNFLKKNWPPPSLATLAAATLAAAAFTAAAFATAAFATAALSTALQTR
jgi:hypothetical protein